MTSFRASRSIETDRRGRLLRDTLSESYQSEPFSISPADGVTGTEGGMEDELRRISAGRRGGGRTSRPRA